MTLDNDTANSSEIYLQAQQEYKILAEYKMLQSENIGGFYVIPSAKSSFLWFGVIFVRDGMFKDGIFRFNISLPELFPDDSKLPTVIFQSDIFHPAICPFTRTLDISEAFPVWKSGETHIWQLLKYIQFILKYPNICLNSEKISNEDAKNLLSQNKAEFIAKVKECVRISQEKVYDVSPTDDKHYIIFEQFDNFVHGPVLESIKNKNDISVSPVISGLSWVKEGVPLSK